MKTIKELADIGAKAAHAKLIEIENGENLLTVGRELGKDFGADRPAREAFAQAVIDAFLEEVGDVPSVEEMAEMLHDNGWSSPNDAQWSRLPNVRTAILAAVAKKLKAAAQKHAQELKRAQDAEADAFHCKSLLAAVRALPEKWKNSHSSHANFAKRLDSHVRDAMDDCANELETALNGKLPVVDKEREAFEVWWEGMEGDLRECSYAWAAWQAARKQPTQQPS